MGRSRNVRSARIRHYNDDISMNTTQKDQVLAEIAKLEEFEIEKEVVKKVGAEESLDDHIFGKFSANEFLTYYKSLIKRFRFGLESREYFLMPFAINIGGVMNGNLHTFLSQFFEKLNSANFAGAAVNLEQLIQYQTIFRVGLPEELSEPKGENYEKSFLLDTYKTSVLQIEELRSEQIKILQDWRTKKSEWEEFIESKKSIIEQVEATLQSSKAMENEIQDIRLSATRSDEELNGMIALKEKDFEQLKTKGQSAIDTKTQEFEQIKQKVENELLKTKRKELDDLLLLYQASIKEIKDKKTELDNYSFELEDTETATGLLPRIREALLSTKKELEHFEKQHGYLQEVIGIQMGKSLSETFSNRKKELNTPVWIWTVATGIMVIVTVIWVYMVFGNFKGLGTSEEGWIVFALNTLKTLPAILLLGFTIDRFRRERKYQEEYAFKSAVALTIKGYMDLLESPENKEKLILESVKGLYTSPVYQKRSKGIDPREVMDIIKKSPELLLEVLKKAK